jgi:PPK2 family polyphosphate:nucleotide phosphotransferase
LEIDTNCGYELIDGYWSDCNEFFDSGYLISIRVLMMADTLKASVLRRLYPEVGEPIRLKHYDPDWVRMSSLKGRDKADLKKDAQRVLAQNLEKLARAQQLLFASGQRAVLIVLQGMDAAGKDGMIKHVMSGLNPQGCQVRSFKQPCADERAHDFLWRYNSWLPERGHIGIFNRSYYEDVLVARVHPELLGKERPKSRKRERELWEDRYQAINALERHLTKDGTVVLKFFLHISRGEQRRRLLERLDNHDKHWKFSMGDVAERAYWDDYVAAYEGALEATNTKWARWQIIPADHKWAARTLVAELLTRTITDLKLAYPEMSGEERAVLTEARKELERDN